LEDEMIPLKKSDVVLWLKSYAKDFELSYDERDEGIEDGLPHTLRLVAAFIDRYAPDEMDRV
jgi:hypothetical protein